MKTDIHTFLDDKEHKRRCFKSHARRRLLERYNINVSDKEWSYLKSKVSEAKFVRNITPIRVLKSFPFKQKTLFFVYDRFVGEIVTFLPPPVKLEDPKQETYSLRGYNA